MASMTLVDVEVCVVGAGVAGLKCAHSLVHDSANRLTAKDVVVLEAQDRIGGRLLTDRTLSKIGAQYDLGAAWFHDSLTNVVLNESIADGTFNWETDGYYDDRDIAVYAEENSGPLDINGLKIQPVVEEIEKYIEIHFFENLGTPDMSLRQVLAQYMEKYGARLTRQQKQFCTRLMRYYELWDGVSWDSISAKFCVMDHHGRNLYNKLGYDFIIRKLAAGLEQVAVRTKQQVATIDSTNPNYILVTTKSGLRLRTRYVVVTTPLSILKLEPSNPYGLVWNPPLPRNMTASLDALHFGALGKVVFEFDSVWWPKDQDRFLILPNEQDKKHDSPIESIPAPYTYPTFAINYAAVNHQKPTPSLVILTQDPLTRFLEANPDKAWAYFKPMLSKLATPGKLFSARVPHPINTITTSWTQNPHIRGAYVALYPGDEAEGINHFLGSEPGYGPGDSRIRFAGEHTAIEGAGCVHGAYMSGEREARWILDQWKEKAAL